MPNLDLKFSLLWQTIEAGNISLILEPEPNSGSMDHKRPSEKTSQIDNGSYL
jgi:hypothetical protein